VLLLGALAGLPGAALAQEPPAIEAVAEAPAPSADTMVTLDYQNAQIEDVIRAISKLTRKNFLFDDRVRGTVTVISETPVSIQEAYEVFESVLQVKGFSTVAGPGGVIKIMPTRDARSGPLATSLGTARPANTDEFITRLIPLRYVKAETIQDTVRQLASKDASIIAYGPTNTLIVTDAAANIRRVLNILEKIDVETYEEQLKVLTIQYADVSELTNQLREIFASDGSSSTPGRLPRARALVPQTQPVGGGLADGGVISAAAGAARFIPDVRTNSIVVLAPLATIQQVEKLVTLLDYKRKGTGRINVYRLQNADAEEIAETLANLADGARAPTPVSGGSAVDASAQTAGVVAQLEGGVKITADAPTNSLIIQSSPEAFAALSDVIEALDIRRPQVLVEALILEVDVDDDFKLGSSFIFNTLLGGSGDGIQPVDRVGGVGSNTQTPGGVGIPNLLPSGSGAAGLPANILSPTNPFVASVLGKTVNFVDAAGNQRSLPVIQAVITAAQSDSRTNILQAPRVLTADNEEAQIVVGQNLGFPTTNLQAATPSGGDPSNPFQTAQNIERRDVGVTLRVTPQISEGETVRLDYFNEVSAVTSATGNLGPTTTKRTVENTVYVKDGETVMIGGMIMDTLGETVNQVPFLGDIPFLGNLFKSRAESTDKVNLIVLLTPHIVRDPIDLQALTLEEREKFRDASVSGERTPAELEARERALDAGIALPDEKNPVGGKLRELEQRYPTETLPELEKERGEREQERREQLLQQSEAEAGDYTVQAAVLSRPDAAVAILQRLIELGFDGSVVSRSENGSELHSVELGPYANEEQARDAARRLRAQAGLNPVVRVAP
jgi:general secretion pathway protein D